MTSFYNDLRILFEELFNVASEIVKLQAEDSDRKKLGDTFKEFEDRFREVISKLTASLDVVSGENDV